MKNTAEVKGQYLYETGICHVYFADGTSSWYHKENGHWMTGSGAEKPRLFRYGNHTGYDMLMRKTFGYVTPDEESAVLLAELFARDKYASGILVFSPPSRAWEDDFTNQLISYGVQTCYVIPDGAGEDLYKSIQQGTKGSPVKALYMPVPGGVKKLTTEDTEIAMTLFALSACCAEDCAGKSTEEKKRIRAEYKNFFAEAWRVGQNGN